MPISTWIDKITDESNTWFNACRLEDIGNYADAIILYLDDSTESLRKGSLSRAGLSCSCAADCLVKLRVEVLPKKIYFKAATIYREITESASHRSIREWLWSLKKAYENFVLAGETSIAYAVLGEYIKLAKRIQPNILEVEPPTLKSNTQTLVATSTAMDLPEKVINAVNSFLEQHDTISKAKKGSSSRSIV